MFRRLQRRLIKFAPAIVSTTSRYTGLFETSLPAERGNVLGQRLKNRRD